MIFRINGNKFLPHQREWWKLPNFIKLLVGGYGCGKTYIGALRCLYNSYRHKGLPGKYVSPTHKMAQETIIKTTLDIINRCGLVYNYNKTLGHLVILNWDGHIWFGSGDKPDSLRGPNQAWAGIDEPFIQDIEVLNQMLARVRIGNKEDREIFLTGTPEQLNWGYDLAMNDDNRYDVGVVYGKTKDNIHIGEEYYKSMYNAFTPEMREAYLNGKFINLREGKAYKPFDRNVHVAHRDVQGLEICAGQDFNVDYMSTEIFALGNGWVHFIDEIRLTYSNSFEAAELLQRKYPGIRIFCDPTGGYRKTSATKSDHQIFADAGFRVHHLGWKEQIRPMDHINSVNKLLINNNLTIEPGKCPNLVKDFERVVFKSGDVDKTSDLSLTHASDAAGYPMYYLFPLVKRVAYV